MWGQAFRWTFVVSTLNYSLCNDIIRMCRRGKMHYFSKVYKVETYHLDNRTNIIMIIWSCTKVTEVHKAELWCKNKGNLPHMKQKYNYSFTDHKQSQSVLLVSNQAVSYNTVMKPSKCDVLWKQATHKMTFWPSRFTYDILWWWWCTLLHWVQMQQPEWVWANSECLYYQYNNIILYSILSTNSPSPHCLPADSGLSGQRHR